MSSLTSSVSSDDVVQIIKGEPFSQTYDFSSNNVLEVATMYNLSVRLLTARGSTVWTKIQGTGIVRTALGWLLTLSATDTNQTEGIYLLAIELKAIASGIPTQASVSIEITKDLID